MLPGSSAKARSKRARASVKLAAPISRFKQPCPSGEDRVCKRQTPSQEPKTQGRSLPHLIETVNGLEARGVSFRSLTEAIDTTTPGGRLIFHIFGALGQFERDLIRERTRAGLDAAMARGRRGGRKPVVTDEKLRRAQTLVAQGLTVREAAARIKVGKTALYAALAQTVSEHIEGLP